MTYLETTALGAAFLAGVAVGVWPGQDALAAFWESERRFEPAMADDQREAMISRWGRAVERARAWAEE